MKHPPGIIPAGTPVYYEKIRGFDVFSVGYEKPNALKVDSIWDVVYYRGRIYHCLNADGIHLEP